jgi:hypothetical protein
MLFQEVIKLHREEAQHSREEAEHYCYNADPWLLAL